MPLKKLLRALKGGDTPPAQKRQLKEASPKGHRPLKEALKGYKGGGSVAVKPAKAKEILHHGSVRGHELTPKQQRFMGARASGQPMRKTPATRRTK